ncbi:hypothetical protein [Afipia birgiae]|uniref:hypothetical protein n=1 Tax=Afipia birgiae TaxID=151414 RepID=UPI0012EC65D7|nr:hypothetical protein [Afipia birgiae]
MAGFSCESILCRDRFSANLTEIGQYSPTLSQNIPVFREPKPETGSIALNAGQNGDKFPSQPPDLTGLFWTKLCEKLSLERSFGHAEEEV